MSVAIGSFLAFSAAQVGTPGPANMALMAAGARHGLGPALPFVAGVALGKQLVIWPLGLGLMELARSAPGAFGVLKWVSAAYVCWLAWRLAGLRLSPQGSAADVPGFFAGLAVHPLNPKAWAMVIAAFANFVSPGTPALQATLVIATCFLATQAVLHPGWAWGGARLAGAVAGTAAEPWLMRALALLTVASVALVLATQGEPG